MIKIVEGNLLESRAEALVNTVNTVGIMGKGIALQFKTQFPNNFKTYAKACKEGSFKIGDLLVTEEENLFSEKKIIINFPTKTDWRKPSEYHYIEKGLQELVKLIQERKIKSIALPPIGTGNGGLKWNEVMARIERYLSDIDCEILVFKPNVTIHEVLKKERVSLTPARAMLLSVLYDLVREGEFVSEFSCEKVAYFLQKFGAKDVFKLDYEANFYGPYSGKVKHVLYHLNGSYIMGYSSKDKKPFEELELIMDAEDSVRAFLENKEEGRYLQIVTATKEFLSGFYSSFALELLSSVDFIIRDEKVNNIEEVKNKLESWSDRKKTLFSDERFISIAVEKLHASAKCA